MVVFSFLAGVLVGGAGILVARPLWHRATGPRGRRYLLGGAFAGAFALAATLIYLGIGSRRSVELQPNATSMARPATPPALNADHAGSMDAEVAKLAARLSRDGGSPADWTLLAQAYEVLGRPDDAQRARAHLPAVPVLGASALSEVGAKLSEDKTLATNSDRPVSPVPLRELERRANDSPREAQNWLALADARRTQRDYQGARADLEKVIALKAMSAQSWADYADTVATLNGGSLAGAAGTAIDSALTMDPANTKALWLKASQAHESRHFAEALAWWKKLRALLPPDSPDSRVIDDNIVEDNALAAGKAPPAHETGIAAMAASGGAAVAGTVSLDSHLADRVRASDTLFIYAKAVDAPGPPLAVFRTVAGAWPVDFRLDDSMAMLPTRRLSQFDKVVVEARISRSGQATPSSGDLYGTSAVLNPSAAKKLALVISREIG